MSSPPPASAAARTTASPIEVFFISLLCFGWAIRSSTEIAAGGFNNSAFTDATLQSIVGIELLFGGCALLVLRWRRYAVATLYPAPTWSGAIAGTGLLIVAILLSTVACAPFVNEATVQPLSDLQTGMAVSLPMVVLMSIVNGVYEEVFLLGYVQRALGAHGHSLAIGVSLLVRVLYHLYQGPVGAASVLAFGAVLSVWYALRGQLFPAVFAHVLADILALT